MNRFSFIFYLKTYRKRTPFRGGGDCVGYWVRKAISLGKSMSFDNYIATKYIFDTLHKQFFFWQMDCWINLIVLKRAYQKITYMNIWHFWGYMYIHSSLYTVWIYSRSFSVHLLTNLRFPKDAKKRRLWVGHWIGKKHSHWPLLCLFRALYFWLA